MKKLLFHDYIKELSHNRTTIVTTIQRHRCKHT
uniref:Uncharacterized protein n=1 Tax=Rhizophora mucronata TaxID=61149 RepID=A0A2P2NSR1_RHIMU